MATLTPLGPRQYTRMPLGLVDLGVAMQKAIHQTLEGIEGCIAYIDDILVFGETKEAHDAVLCQVLHRLQAKDFRLQL